MTSVCVCQSLNWTFLLFRQKKPTGDLNTTSSLKLFVRRRPSRNIWLQEARCLIFHRHLQWTLPIIFTVHTAIGNSVKEPPNDTFPNVKISSLIRNPQSVATDRENFWNLFVYNVSIILIAI